MYDAKGHLGTVRDVAGNDWIYHYGEIGRLTASTGPNGEAVLRAKDDGRVVESQTGRTFSFRYLPRKTIVTEDGGQTHTFEHDAQGATVGFQSSGGISWRVAFDGRGRVRELVRPDGSHSFAYGRSSGKLTRIVERFPNDIHHIASEFDYDTDSPFAVSEFDYDAKGRLVASSSYGGTVYTHVDYADNFVRLTHSDGRQFEYGYSMSGDMVHLRDGEDTLIVADYDNAGAPLAFHSGTDSVLLDRDSVGRVISVRYANGTINRYTYDELGNRQLAEYGNGASVQYLYDTSGNIRRVVVRNRDGSSRRQSVEVGDLNQIERIVYEDEHSIDITYGSSGHPTAFDFGTEQIKLRYNERGIANSVVFESTGQIRALEQKTVEPENRDRVLFDSRLSVLARDSHGMVQPNYGVLQFGETTFDAIILDPMELGVPGLTDARRLCDARGDGFRLTRTCQSTLAVYAW